MRAKPKRRPPPRTVVKHATILPQPAHLPDQAMTAMAPRPPEPPHDLWRHRALNMRCRTCIFFVPKAKGLGRCRRHAPTLGGWPAVFDMDWCGDHKLDETKL